MKTILISQSKPADGRIPSQSVLLGLHASGCWVVADVIGSMNNSTDSFQPENFVSALSEYLARCQRLSVSPQIRVSKRYQKDIDTIVQL